MPIAVGEFGRRVQSAARLRGRLDTVRPSASRSTPRTEVIARGALAATEGADLAVVTPMSNLLVALSWGELPTVGLYLQPLMPTRDHPPVAFRPAQSCPFNRAAGQWYLRSLPGPAWPTVQRLRAERGLPPLPPPARYIDHCSARPGGRCSKASASTVPDPADLPAGVRTVGYCWPVPTPTGRRPQTSSASSTPASRRCGELSARCRSATRSTPAHRARRGTRRRAAGDLPSRMGCCVGWRGRGRRPAHRACAARVLLPRAAAFVHHAGAGTSAAGLRAGVPAVPVPVLLDPAVWRTDWPPSVAPQPIPLHHLTVDKLTDALRQATTDPRYERRGRRAGDPDQAEGWRGYRRHSHRADRRGLPLD